MTPVALRADQDGEMDAVGNQYARGRCDRKISSSRFGNDVVPHSGKVHSVEDDLIDIFA